MSRDATAADPDVHAVAEALRVAVNSGNVAAILACWASDGVLQPPHHSRQPDGSWKLTQDIWNSDVPPMRPNADSASH
jgi:ketosteroid isomerase-like protein